MAKVLKRDSETYRRLEEEKEESVLDEMGLRYLIHIMIRRGALIGKLRSSKS